MHVWAELISTSSLITLPRFIPYLLLFKIFNLVWVSLYHFQTKFLLLDFHSPSSAPALSSYLSLSLSSVLSNFLLAFSSLVSYCPLLYLSFLGESLSSNLVLTDSSSLAGRQAICILLLTSVIASTSHFT